nr:MAG TPA: hypothetical protein [Microviridae sp.]
MSGIVTSKPMDWRADFAPTSEPTINEFLITLRTLHYVRREMNKKEVRIPLRQSMSDVIMYLESISPNELCNIINLLYNS